MSSRVVLRRHWAIKCDSVRSRHVLGGEWCDGEQHMYSMSGWESLWCGGDECHSMCSRDILSSGVWERDDVSCRVILYQCRDVNPHAV